MTAAPRRSLRARLVAIGGAGLVAAIAALVVGGILAGRLQREVRAATSEVLEEQRIADQITTGVMRQLATISAASGVGDTLLRVEFDAAGALVGEGVRAYLFRELSFEERLALEQVNEAHQRMEIAAVRAAQSALAGEDATRAVLQAEAIGHARALLDAMDGFIRLREADFEALLARQAGALRRIWWFGGGTLALVGCGLALLLVRFTRRRITVPLAALGDASRRIGAGDLAARVPEEQDAEFRALAQSFNRMAEQLATAQAERDGRTEALEAALAEVRQAQGELLESEKIGALGRMTAGLAHELNNPLASVLGMATLLETELREGDAPARAELLGRYVEPIVREATRARLLVRSLLQFSRRAGGAVSAVPLREALAVVADLRHHAFELAGLRLDVGPVPEVAVMAEPQQLQAIFLNLVNNALHALGDRPGGILAVRAEVHDRAVTLTFSDDGPGLADLERIFEPFYTTKPVGEGTGLGLALSRRFVESFGGTLRAENRVEGGARFTLTLRLTDLPHAAAPAVAPDPVPNGTLAGRVVLVVDDEPELRALSERALARLGVTVRLAADAREARALLAAERVDAVVSDVKMPGESGIDLHRWVVAHHPSLASRFLFVTGDVSDPVLAELAEARPQAVILKPFDLREYLVRVRQLLD